MCDAVHEEMNISFSVPPPSTMMCTKCGATTLLAKAHIQALTINETNIVTYIVCTECLHRIHNCREFHELFINNNTIVIACTAPTQLDEAIAMKQDEHKLIVFTRRGSAEIQQRPGNLLYHGGHPHTYIHQEWTNEV